LIQVNGLLSGLGKSAADLTGDARATYELLLAGCGKMGAKSRSHARRGA